jgi:hypothetical protein
MFVFGTPLVYEGLNTVEFTVLNKFVAVDSVSVKSSLKYSFKALLPPPPKSSCHTYQFSTPSVLFKIITAGVVPSPCPTVSEEPAADEVH